MNNGVYQGIVRGYNSATKRATVVVPQLFDMKPVECEPFVANDDEWALLTPVTSGDRVLVLWDGGQANALPKWIPGQSYSETVTHWNSAWGTVGEYLLNAIIDISTTATTIATLSVPTVLGRRYKVSFAPRACEASSVTSVVFRINELGGAGVGDHFQLATTNAAGYGAGATMTWRFDGTGSVQTLTLMASMFTGTGRIHAQGGPATRYVVEDIGPVANAAIPVPAAPRVVAEGNALGIVAMGAPLATNPSTFTGNASSIISNPIYFTMQVGRRYRMRYNLRASLASTAGSHLSVVPWMDGVSQYPVVGDRYADWPTTTNFYQVDAEWMFDGDGQMHKWEISASFNSTSVTYTLYQNGMLWYIEDIGPNTSPALPIPTTDPPWTPMSGLLQNGFTQYPGSQWFQPAYRRIGDVVYLRGLVRVTSSVSSGVLIAQLPIGFRPAAGCIFSCMGASVAANTTHVAYRVDVLSDGTMLVRFGAAQGFDYLSLDPIRFSTTA